MALPYPFDQCDCRDLLGPTDSYATRTHTHCNWQPSVFTKANPRVEGLREVENDTYNKDNFHLER